MRSCPIEEADLATLMARALNGEPQRITGPGAASVVLVSETDWTQRSDVPRRPLADILLSHAGEDFAGFAEEQRWTGMPAEGESGTGE